MTANVGSRIPRVLLTREGNIIVAKFYSFLGQGLMGVAARCDDGSVVLYSCSANPTNREYYRVDVSDAANYEAKRSAVLRATGWSSDEEFEWLETDSNGDVIPGTDTNATITAWLNRDIREELLESWCSGSVSQYAPGFEIMARLTPREIDQLKMREANLGGPASSVPCVASLATLQALNDVLKRKNLPFIFVDDEGSREV